MPRATRSWIASREISAPSSLIEPLRRLARPMSNSSRVVLPTPLRPTMATVSPAATVNEKSSTLSVGPQPPDRPEISSMARLPAEACAAGGPEVDRLHVGRRHHRLGRTGHQHPAMHQHRHLGGEAAHDLHVVLDQQDRDLRWQRVDRVEQDADLAGGNAGRRPVEKEDPGLECERDRDLYQPLTTIGDLSDRAVAIVAEPQAL